MVVGGVLDPKPVWPKAGFAGVVAGVVEPNEDWPKAEDPNAGLEACPNAEGAAGGFAGVVDVKPPDVVAPNPPNAGLGDPDGAGVFAPVPRSIESGSVDDVRLFGATFPG